MRLTQKQTKQKLLYKLILTTAVVIAVAVIGEVSEIEAYERNINIINPAGKSDKKSSKANNEVLSKNRELPGDDKIFRGQNKFDNRKGEENPLCQLDVFKCPEEERQGNYLSEQERQWVINTVADTGLATAKQIKCLIEHESSWNEKGYLDNGKNGQDRGLWAINNKYQPQVSDECAYDYKCSTQEAIKIIKSWGNLKAWHGYTKNCI